MAVKTWRGDAPAVKQESRATPGGTIQVGDQFHLTIGGKTVTFTATAGTVANVTAGLTAAWNALDQTAWPEHSEVTASDQATYVKLLADEAGRPFTVVATTTDGGGAATETLTMSTPVASSGPNHWDAAANWLPSGVPVSADDVNFESSSISVLYGLDQSAVSLTSLTFWPTYTGDVGLPKRNLGGYSEYRDDYLRISATTVNVRGGSGRVKINLGAVLATINVERESDSPAEQDLESVLVRGTNAGNVLNVSKGSVGVAVFAGETSVIATLRCGYRDSVQGDARVRCGSGVTLTTVDQTGGDLKSSSAITTCTQTNGVHEHTAGVITTLNLDGGTVYYTSTSTLATANVGSDGALDFTRDARARTVTTCNLNTRGAVRDPHKSVTWTNGVDLERCGIADVELDLGTHVKLTAGAPT